MGVARLMEKTQNFNLKKRGIIAIIIYFIVSILFYGITKNEFNYKLSSTDMLTPTIPPIGEIVTDTVIEQNFSTKDDEISSMSFYISTYDRENTTSLIIEIFENDNKLFQQQLMTTGVKDNEKHTVVFDQPLTNISDKDLTLRITSPDGSIGNAITLWYGNTATASKVEVNQFILENDKVHLNGVAQNGKLCFTITTTKNLWIGNYYWLIVAVVFAILSGYTIYANTNYKKGKIVSVVKMLLTMKKYQFLIKQLVARDFKTKYKRSVLGVMWSFLNPLLSMLVQYIVFSTLFKSDIPNFVVYLLSGIVCFSFFSESTTMGLVSIVHNGPLITKVYVPKYIYPVTRMLSSTVNLLLSLIPLLITVVLTGTKITPAILLLPIPLICLCLFSLGISLFLSALMVFFRDIQFIWSVLIMMGMYLTPIFYPETIIPAQYMALYKMNPLYHFIRFIRSILIDGISPEPKAYLFCFIAALVPLAIGTFVFKKTQDKFVLNL